MEINDYSKEQILKAARLLESRLHTPSNHLDINSDCLSLLREIASEFNNGSCPEDGYCSTSESMSVDNPNWNKPHPMRDVVSPWRCTICFLTWALNKAR